MGAYAKGFRIGSYVSVVLQANVKTVKSRFPMYQLIQDLAKFTELAAIQHKTISTGLIGSGARMSKAMPKIRRDLIDMVRHPHLLPPSYDRLTLVKVSRRQCKISQRERVARAHLGSYAPSLMI